MAQRARFRHLAAEIRRRIDAEERATRRQLGRLDDVAAEFNVSRATAERAVTVLESEGYSWALQRSGVTPPDRAIRTRRPRGNLVKRSRRDLGYSFPSVSSQETWVQHGHAVMDIAEISDGRLAALLQVPVGSHVMRQSRVTGPAAEAPFQLSTSWIHPRVAELIADIGKYSSTREWLRRIERTAHWPIGWIEFQRARMPTDTEARLLEIEVSLPVIEIMRLARSGADSKPIEVTECIIASDRVELVNVLHHDLSAQEPWPTDPSDAPDGETL